MSTRKRKDRRVAMTPAWCERVKPEVTPVEWRDAKQPGLVLRVELSGRTTWIARYWFEERDARFVIGRFPQTTLKAARARARKIIGLAEDGHDPQEAKTKRRVGGTVAVAVQSWLADKKLGPVAKWKGGLTGGTARSFMPHVRAFEHELGTKRLAELTPKICDTFVIQPEAAATRNRRLTSLRLFCS